ncbi:2-polyprenyl-6-methoxyphenol hydroxylase [Prauserella marina]|uniref:Salicylate hydroxylase n=1 Tax=Prauserella marina TaxID=530584 RepID=A0A222VPZ3_9PSEU|nr:FAD-dependent monooxygenase [Prauserella marina]ASR35996.1 2-polyprenyl-6-methoxyphenol hydroxylase [Prauserella marina]PWV84059.1 salicylate hydroxylase [Prauserella marina]SDC31465.1 salicylate hydroxylase [Prauserella marina]
MATDQVIIAGGGIGGLGAAVHLARSGVRVRVLERSPEFAEVGAGLQLAPNITRMLDQIGVLDKILPRSVRPRRLVFRNAESGEELTHLDLTDAHARYGGPYLVLHRSDLLQALLEAARGEDLISLHTDHHVTGFTDNPDAITVTCANGAEFTGRLLLGADGLHSTIRKEIITDEPLCSGYVAYRGAVPIEQVDRRAALDDVCVWMGPGMHLVQYPVRAGELYNQVAVFRSQEYLEGKQDWGTPEELDRMYSGMCEAVRVAIPSLQRNNRWPMYDREPAATWTKGRISLLGDAAHPMLQYLAQGAGQALLDGAALAKALPALGTGSWSLPALGEALGGYEGERLALAGRVQSSARVWGDIWHVDQPVATLLRDEVFRSRDIHDYHLVDWLYGPVREGQAPTRAPATPAGSDVPTPA